MEGRLPQGLKVAIYARVSTEEQREGQTIDSQVSELESFARQNGWPIAGIYKDEGWSGGLMERPELDHLRDDARRGVFRVVLINDVDRLARDVTHLGVIKRDLERHQIRVIFRKLPTETSPTYNLMVNILGSFAEFERELIADRTRRGRRYKVEVRKQFLGTKSAYGYRYIPADRTKGQPGRLEIIAQEAAVVRQMFSWVDEEGLSARRVLARLKELRIRPRGGAAHWGRSSVLRILRNEMYAGVWHYNKYQRVEPRRVAQSKRYSRSAKSSTRKRPKAEWLPWAVPESLQIVTRERWERVQKQLDRNIAFSPRNEKHSYLLKSLVRCGGCGARYVGDPSHGKYYYRCLERCRKLPSIREETLNETVWMAITEAILNPDTLIERIKRFQEHEVKRLNEQRTTAVEVQKEIEEIDKEESRILEAYRTGLISPTQLATQLETIKARREAAGTRQNELAELPSTSGKPTELEDAIRRYCQSAAPNIRSFDWLQRRHFLRLLIREITFLGSSVRIQGSLPIETTPRERALGYPGRDQTEVLAPAGGIVTMAVARGVHSPASKGQEPDANLCSAGPDVPTFVLAHEIERRPRPPQPRSRFGRFVARSERGGSIRETSLRVG